MGADLEWCIPVPFVCIFAFTGLRFDTEPFPALFIISGDITILICRVHDIGIIRLNSLVESVTAQGNDPVIAGDT